MITPALKIVLIAVFAAVFTLPAQLHASDNIPASEQHNSAIPLVVEKGARPTDREIETTVLLYHYIEPLSSDNAANKLRKDFTTTPEAFEEQLKHLREEGFESIDLYHLYEALKSNMPLPPKTVVITFDDGDISLYTQAFPLMKEYGFTGTIFMVTQFTEENKPGYLTWDQALEMAEAGWRLEPHTKTHPSLKGNSREYQRDQIGGSMEAIKSRIGYTPRFFAYPYGQYDNVSLEVAREVGLWGAVTTSPGDTHKLLSIYELPRMELFSSTTPQTFKKYLEYRKPGLL